ncbi:MAG: sulfotransferase [Hyphomicrobiaceae bacterium]
MSTAQGIVIRDYCVCVGAQKAGTTWLARMLSRHPEIFVTPVKEIHYFDHVRQITQHLSDRKRRSRLRKHYQRLLTQWGRLTELKAQNGWYSRYMEDPIDDDWYRGLFANRLGRRMAFEATPEYAIIGEAGFSHIARLAPEARVLFIMRNPVRQAWSQVLHRCRSLRRDVRRLDEPALHAMLADDRLRALGDYPATLTGLAAVFPRDRMQILFYEEIHADRLNALAAISAFLGVGFQADRFKELEARHNKSQDVALPDALRRNLQVATRDLAIQTGTLVGRLPDSWRSEYGL